VRVYFAVPPDVAKMPGPIRNDKRDVEHAGQREGNRNFCGRERVRSSPRRRSPAARAHAGKPPALEKCSVKAAFKFCKLWERGADDGPTTRL
jgi:hypothetical protein